MKIVICTTPIRPTPTDYPPFGSLAVLQALREAGYDPVFLDIDGLRPSFAQVLDRLQAEAPDVIGISAVVSTAYGYVKKFCQAVRAVLPSTKLVLGGNLAASAEILHRLCHIDVCVIGEGERIIVNLARYYREHVGHDDFSQLEKIKGITYLDPKGEMIFTGYEAAIPAHELLDPDFSILETHSNIRNFIADPFARESFAADPRSHEPHRKGQKMATVVSAKGCVARCTFCHRWDKGFRQVPPGKVVERINYLKNRYNVGFIQFGDENFGSDRKATEELIRLIKPLDILWHVGGVRVCSVDRDLLRRMKDAGCVSLYFGFETGSPDILEVMEKKLDLEDNDNAARWMHETGLSTIYQLVLGMPGENRRTLEETIEMVKRITEFLPEPPAKYLSVNYIQALPGTPVYEYARAKGMIGISLQEEEAYLLEISDIDAGDDTKFINFTEYPYLAVQSWRTRLLFETTVHWHHAVHRRASQPPNGTVRELEADYEKGGYFNRQTVAHHPLLLQALYPIRGLAIWTRTLWSQYRRAPTRVFFIHLWELVTWPFKSRQIHRDYRSLRHVMRDVAPKPKTNTEAMMMPLRLGR
ncbi:MAG: radical SAM protein [Nitrospira sp.]|nr:radical SAM protein [Nitrospira sp.]